MRCMFLLDPEEEDVMAQKSLRAWPRIELGTSSSRRSVHLPTIDQVEVREINPKKESYY